MIDKNIQIQNIYYMLLYCFKTLRSNEYEKLSNESFENIYDLLSEILIKGISYEIKKGLGKEYILEIDELTAPKGKIDITNSIKYQTLLRKNLICNYDEFSVNMKLNQIIKSTVYLILKKGISSERKNKLKKLMMYFKDVDTIDLNKINWNVKFNKNNATYQMLINICYLLVKGILQNEETGNKKLENFLDDQLMSSLYENFIFEYYKKEFPNLKVTRPSIDWKADGTDDNLKFLPKMKTDIVIENKEKNKIRIIDAKYYSRTLQKNYDKSSFHSNNLYQIFAYVENFKNDESNEVSGMLLYAKTDEEITPNSEFKLKENLYFIKTLDLNLDFNNIEDQLKLYVKDLM